MTPRVLVIDDNPTNLKLVQWVLSSEGFEVCAATSAEAGLELVGTEAPELVVIDLALPGLDGLEFTRRLRASPTTQTLPIVAMTSFAMDSDKAKALAAGCDAYVTKPIDTRTLAAQLRQLLETAHPPSPPEHENSHR